MKKTKLRVRAVRQPQTLDVNQRYSVEESLTFLKFSRALFYERVNAGRLTACRDGGRTYVTGAELVRYIQSV